MSAIVGIFHLTGEPVSAETLQPAMEAVAHYGGNGQGIWISDTVGLGHQMQHLTPESLHESLPYTLSSLTVTADARIDNREELFDALGIGATEGTQIPDSVLILLAYRRWGEACATRLLGDFAFAIYDASDRTLFCARDPVGARPFYYYATPGRFAFASDIKGILAFPHLKVAISEVEIARYLLCNAPIYIDNTHTFYQHVYKLPFAHWLTISPAGIRQQCYWVPGSQPELHLGSVDEYADALFELVQLAVRDRLRACVKVGAHISGGIDSSSIAVLAARHLRQEGYTLPVFSWSPPREEMPPASELYDKPEHDRIEAICQQEGLEPIYTPRDLMSIQHLRMLDISTDPVNSLIYELSVQRRASAQGIRLLLSGWGGDEAASFNGRGALAECFLTGNWRSLAAFLNLRQAWKHPRQLKGVLSRLWNTAFLPTLPDRLYFAFQKRALYAQVNNPFIQPLFANRIQPYLRPPDPQPRELGTVRQSQLRLWEYGHLTARMESWAAAGAYHGITYAYPLTDRRVLEFAYALPRDLFLRRVKGYSIGRYLYRYTMARILPQGMPWQDMKQDVSLMARTRQIIANPNTTFSHEWWDVQELLQWNLLKQPNPWVDGERLQAALRSLEDGFSLQDMPTMQGILLALACLVIWQNQQQGLTRITL